MIYLASPYSSPRSDIRQRRYDEVVEAIAAMTKAGLNVYSPIVHFHIASVRHNLPGDFEFWQRINLDMIDRADKFWVFKQHGWTESKGVQAEIAYASGMYHIEYVEPYEWLK